MNSWEPVISRLRQIYEAVSNATPDQSVVLWIQLIVGCLTIIWIIFQFNWLRRLNEARLERYLEDRITTERDDLVQERAEAMTALARLTRRRGVRYALLLIWVNVRLVISFMLRLLSLGVVRGLKDHTPLLMQVGMLHRARTIHTDAAHSAIRKMRLYEAAVANKRMEAQNALLFAGRVAVLEKRPMAAAASFRKARALKDDPDARLLIGQHLAALSDTNGALNEYRAALAHPSINEKPGTAAELHRSVAQVLIQRNARGTARTELEHAKSLDANLSDYLGLGKTHELIGDLYAPRTHNRNAAETAYHVAIENFVRADDASSARRVRHKLSSLTGMPTIQKDDGITRMLDKCGHYLLKLVDKLRSQAQRRQD